MNIYLIIVLGIVLCSNVAGYTFVQDNLTVHNCNKNVVSVAGRVSNGLCISFKLKDALPAKSKVFIKAFRKVNNNFIFSGISIKTTVQEVLSLRNFDLESLFNKCFKPAAKWPLVAGTEYRCESWNPDPSKFPPSLPGGEWKSELSFMYPNDTKIVDVHWFAKVVN